jgi:hypothetical protein
VAGHALAADVGAAGGPPPADAANPLDPAECVQTLAVLTQLARANGAPVVLCFDQINNLPREQIAEVSRLLHDLNDRLRNVLLILSEVQEELLKLTAAGVISQATWDRLSAHTVRLPRLTVPQGRQILEARLEAFLQQYEDVPDVSRQLKKDSLFPLGTGWFDERFRDITELRARHLIVIARERWLAVQKSLAAAADKRAGLDRWPEIGSGEAIKKPVPAEQLIDACVGKAIADRMARHDAAKHTLPPNADNLCGLVATLLDAGGVGLAIDRPKKGAKGPPYHCIVRRPKPGGGETTTGVLAVSTGSATSVTATLAKLLGDRKPPDRVVLVTDERQPLAFSPNQKAQGRNHYAGLKKEARFEHLTLPFPDYAMLEALDFYTRQASDLEVDVDGRPRPLTRAEVVASYRRGKRFENHPLLGKLVAATSPPTTTITAAEIEGFIAGRLAISIGASTPELARMYMNELPPERRVGLDPATCQARIEEVARRMAGTGAIQMTKLPDGFILLPLRRPAAV